MHQLALSTSGLQTWTLFAARTGLISRNKEGLVSLPGFLAIYVLGLETGEHILRPSSPKQRKHTAEDEERHMDKRRTELALELFSYSAAWWAALAAWKGLGGEVSRRLANLPYVLWTAAYNSTFLFTYLVIELLLSPTPPTPPLLEAINANGLVIFLIANLLTGLINLSMKTMYADGLTSLVVLVGYSAAVCTSAWLLRRWNLKI